MNKKQVMLALTAAAGLGLTALHSAPAASCAPSRHICQHAIIRYLHHKSRKTECPD